jgi:hypothetical protein
LVNNKRRKKKEKETLDGAEAKKKEAVRPPESFNYRDSAKPFFFIGQLDDLLTGGKIPD